MRTDLGRRMRSVFSVVVQPWRAIQSLTFAPFLRNVSANVASQVFASLLAILSIPALVSSLGAEGYGLAGVFLLMQAWFGLLDLGLSQALMRQTVRTRAGTTSPQEFAALYRAIWYLFLVVGLAATLALLVSAGWLSTSWLSAVEINADTVRACLQLMAIAGFARWLSSLYRALAAGFEAFTWLALFNVATSVLRFPGAIAVLWFIDTDSPILLFAAYQVGLGIVELFVLSLKGRHLTRTLPDVATAPSPSVRGGGRQLLIELRFSIFITVSSIVWIVGTQSDRITLSGLLPLDEYGMFVIGVTVAGGVLMISQPILNVVNPRLTRTIAVCTPDEVRTTYVRLTTFVAYAVFPLAAWLAATSPQILRLWTGSNELADYSASTVSLYALGNALLAVCSFGYYLQFGQGNLRLHMVIVGVQALVIIPLQIALVIRYGAVGAGAAWLGMQVVVLVLWMPYLHRRRLPGVHRLWVTHGVALPALTAVVPVVGVAWVIQAGFPFADMFVVIATGVAAVAMAAWGLLRLRRHEGLTVYVGTNLTHQSASSHPVVAEASTDR